MKKIKVLFLCILFVLFYCCKGDLPTSPDIDPIINPPVTPPAQLVASCGADVTEGEVPFTIEFAGSACGGVEPYNYHWDFGDGNIGSGQAISHTYYAYGQYVTVLTVTDKGNAQSTTCTIDGIIVHSEHIINVTAIGETVTSVNMVLRLDFEEEEIGFWFAGTPTNTWQFSRTLREGEYTIKCVLQSGYVGNISGIPFRFSFTAATEDADVEISPPSGDSGWFYFSAYGDYREFKFTITETI